VAFVERRLGKDEFDLRVGRALAALTYADLDALIADIPAASPQQPLPVAGQAPQPYPKSPAAPLTHRQARAVAVIAEAVWARRQLVSLLAGLLLLGAGLMLGSPLAFVAGVVVVGVSAPQAAPRNPEAAMVSAWRWLYRGEAAPPVSRSST
jgi:hypothetical protein